MIERKRFWSIATLVLILLIFAAGHASAQEGTPTATPSAVAAIPLAAIPDGTWLVGQEVTAGIYAAPGGEQCSWKRLSGFGGTSDEVVASAFGAVRPIVEIAPTDRGFSTSNCGQWTPVSSAVHSDAGAYSHANVAAHANGLDGADHALPTPTASTRFPCQRWRFQGAGSGLRMTGWATRWPCLSPGLPSTCEREFRTQSSKGLSAKRPWLPCARCPRTLISLNS